jgi:hypothetical protein
VQDEVKHWDIIGLSPGYLTSNPIFPGEPGIGSSGWYLDVFHKNDPLMVGRNSGNPGSWFIHAGLPSRGGARK